AGSGARLLPAGPSARTRLFPLPVVRQTRDSHHAILVAVQVENSHALRIAADLSDIADLAAQHLALRGHQHDFIAVPYLEESDRQSVALGGFDADDALASTALDAVFADGRALAVPPFGHRENGSRRVRRDRFHPNHLVAFLERNAFDAVGCPSHGPHIALQKADGDALFCTEENLPLAIGDLHADEFVAVFQSERDDTALPWIAVGGELRLLDEAVLGGHDHKPVLGIILHR